MILSIKIPDETYEAFGRHNSQNPRHAIEETLKRFAEVGHLRKAVVLSGEVLSHLQALAGTTLDSPEAVEEFIRKALSIKVDGVEVALTESQRKGLASNAAFFKQDPVEFAKTKIKQGLVTALGV